MSDHYDNKGIRHYSQQAAESANEGYLREERRARDKSAEFQQQQAELQAEQVRLAERQRLDQMIHNARVEAQLEEQAREEAIQREYTRDIQWLERSDAKGKFEFLAAKIQNQFVDSLARRVFDKFTGADSANGKEKAAFNLAFCELDAVNAEAAQTSFALKALNEELEKANKMVIEAKPVGVGFGCLPVAILFVIGGAYMAVERGDLKEEDRVGFSIFLGLFFVLPVAVWAVSEYFKRKRGKSQKLEIEPKISPAREKANKATKLRERAILNAKPLFAAWVDSSARSIKALVNHSFDSGEAKTVLLDLVATQQAQYPPLCRVELNAIGLDVVAATILPLQETVYSSAFRLQEAVFEDYAKAFK